MVALLDLKISSNSSSLFCFFFTVFSAGLDGPGGGGDTATAGEEELSITSASEEMVASDELVASENVVSEHS